MSDLDADLYGDLYGNDEVDFSATNEATVDEKDAPSASAPAPSTSTPVPAAAAAVPKPAAAAVPAYVAPAPQPIASYVTPTAPPTQPLTSPSAPQQIPTYQESTDDVPAVHPQQSMYKPGNNNLQNPERSVRPSEMKDEGKMFIGGLNWDTTDDSLRDYFSQFGKVDACTIMRDAAGRSRCFAFLTFDEPASVNAVMVREHYLDGKIIDPKRAIPRQEHQRATKLFIGGLAGSVTSESMREFFSQFGKVIDSTVMLDRETGRSKGFGFVSLEDVDVQPILGFGSLEIDGKLIDIKLAQPRYQRDTFAEDGEQGAGGGAMPSNNNAGGGGGFNARGGGGGGGNFNSNAGGTPQPFNAATPAGAAGNTPFDPQALASLYTRMFQMADRKSVV